MKNRSLIVALTLVLLGNTGLVFGAETEQPKESRIKIVAKKVKEAINSPKFLISAAVAGIGVLAVAGWWYTSHNNSSESSISAWSDRQVLTKAECDELNKMTVKWRKIAENKASNRKDRAEGYYQLAGRELYYFDCTFEGSFRKYHRKDKITEPRNNPFHMYCLKRAAKLGQKEAIKKLAGVDYC